MNEPLPELIARCQQGDSAAFAKLVAETQEGVYNLAYRILHHKDEAQDMTQEIYLRVWRALPSFRGEARFSTWLYRVAINTCLNRKRQLRSELSMVDDEDALANAAARTADPLATTIKHERRTLLWTAVSRLSEKYRLVITLFYQQQMSYQEIAEMLAIPLGTVKGHLNRAREALAKVLEPERES